MTENVEMGFLKSIDQLEQIKKCVMSDFYQIIQKDEMTPYLQTLEIIMLYNRAVNVVDAIEDASKKGNLIVQTALMRILADLIMTAYRIGALGHEAFIKRIIDKKRLNVGKDARGRSLKDCEIKNRVAADFQDFDKFYDWACKGIHFSEFDQLATLRAAGDFKIDGRISVGADDDATMSVATKNNNTSAYAVNILIQAVKKYVLALDRGEPL